MTLSWTGWEDDPSLTTKTPPYIDWLKLVSFDGAEFKDGISLAPLPMSASAQAITGETTRPAPLPPFARARADLPQADDPQIALDWVPEQDCAIVGVIDSAIALSHARFRRLGSGSRFLAAWLQGGQWRGDAVPFGRELFQREIDRLMFQSHVAGALDEAAFDRAAGVTNYRDPRGDRRLENRATHGTSVADLAAGYDLRQSAQDKMRRRLPLIAVGLPPNTSMGSSGNFLEFFAIHAIDYIVDRAKRIGKLANFPDTSGFPIVINLSYGLQAGPKDGHMLIEQVIRAADAKAEAENRPIRVILPAGNHLLSEGAAKFDLPAGATETLDWRIKPEDQTPNYAELWSDEISGNAPADAAHPLGLSIAPPTGPASPTQPGKDGQCTTLMDGDRAVARIYCRKHEGNGWHRMSYIICTGPTQTDDRMTGVPTGAWRMSVNAPTAQTGFAYVQSDQNLTFGSNTGLLSYFAHKDFDAHDEMGRLIDVDSYPETPKDPVNTDVTPPIRRRGTLNTIASLNEARVIGSFRMTDGKPSYFSSAASSDAVGDGRVAPTCLLPGQDGAARFGLMAAGSRSGSTALFSGTSFSTALATRAVSQAMLGWLDKGRSGTAPGTERWFETEVDIDETDKKWPGKTRSEKAGFGRLSFQDTGRLARTEVPRQTQNLIT